MFIKELLEFHDNFLKDRFIQFSMISNLKKPIVVPIDENGNVVSEIYCLENCERATFLNPCTMESMKRANPPHGFPHPFFDYAKVIFGIVDGYEIKWKGSTPNENGINSIFADNIKKFNSRNGITETIAIEKFFKNCSGVELLHDFVFKNKVADEFVVFKMISDKPTVDCELWNNFDIKNSWCEYVMSNEKKLSTCTLTGKTLPICKNTPNVKTFGSTIFTNNYDMKKGDRFVNSKESNKVDFCYETQFKFTNAVEYLLKDRNSSFTIGDTRTIVFSPHVKNDDYIEFICSQNNYFDPSASEIVRSVKSSSYDRDMIKNNEDIFVMSFSKSGKVLTILDYYRIDRGQFHENIDFWKENFSYDVIDNEGNLQKRRFSVYEMLKGVENCERMKISLMKCMMNKTTIPNEIVNTLKNVAKQKWISNMSSNSEKAMRYDIGDIDKKILSIKNFNEKIKGNKMEENNRNRDVLLGKIFMSLFSLEDYYRFKTGSGTMYNNMYGLYGRFMQNPNEVIMKFMSKNGFMIKYAKNHNFYSLSAFEKYSYEMGEKGFNMTDRVSDYANFALGKHQFSNEMSEMIRKSKTNEVQ